MRSLLAKLGFGRKKTPKGDAGQNIITAPLSDEKIQAEISNKLGFEPPQVLVACGQSTGKQRDHNEDSLFAITITLGNGTNSQPIGLFMVADGMGGHQYGEVASNVAVRTIASYLLEKLTPILADASTILDESIQELMRSALREAQHSVLKAAPGSGTTLTAALVMGQQMTIAHIGDSRAYSIQSEGRISLLTRDHSLVHRLEELGQITADEAITHPQRNVLLRALGQGEYLEPDIFTSPFPQPGYLFLCSDGLWGVVPEADIYHIVSKARNIQTACQDLVEKANAAGGPDNISVILIQLLS